MSAVTTMSTNAKTATSIRSYIRGFHTYIEVHIGIITSDISMHLRALQPRGHKKPSLNSNEEKYSSITQNISSSVYAP